MAARAWRPPACCSCSSPSRETGSRCATWKSTSRAPPATSSAPPSAWASSGRLLPRPSPRGPGTAGGDLARRRAAAAETVRRAGPRAGAVDQRLRPSLPGGGHDHAARRQPRAPIPLRRGDEKPFARFVEDTSGALLTLPPWLEAMTGLSLDSRIALALQALRVTGLLAVPGAAAAPLLPAPGADQWIRRPIGDRTRLVVERLGEGDGRPRLFDLLEEDRLFDGDRQGEIFPWLAQAFGSVPVTHLHPVRRLRRVPGRHRKPAREPRWTRRTAASLTARRSPPRRPWKSCGSRSSACSSVGASCLSGEPRQGLTTDGRPGFRMTEAGLGLLGVGVPPRSSADHGGSPADTPLIVQPNFEIVFLAPSPAAEAELGRFCERIGREIGVLFRISRQSLQRAGTAGMGAEEVIALLTRRSRNPLPANVQHEIRGWGSGGATAAGATAAGATAAGATAAATAAAAQEDCHEETRARLLPFNGVVAGIAVPHGRTRSWTSAGPTSSPGARRRGGCGSSSPTSPRHCPLDPAVDQVDREATGS